MTKRDRIYFLKREKKLTKITFLVATVLIIFTCLCVDVVAASKETDYSLVFDARYYADRYPDLALAGIKSDSQLLNHFVNHGMKEGRRGNEEFDVYAYKTRYADLQVVFGNDLKKYYLHYINSGKAEGRSGKLVEESSSMPKNSIQKKKASANDKVNENYSGEIVNGIEMCPHQPATCPDGSEHSFEFKYISNWPQEVKYYEMYTCSKCKAEGRKHLIPRTVTESEAYELIINMKTKYPDNSVWNSNNSYSIHEPHGYMRLWACGGFAAMLSDAAFEYREMKIHEDIYAVKIGDMVTDKRPGISHMFVVIGYDDYTVTIAEGNRGGRVSWGRQIAKAELDGHCKVTTRY